MKRFFSIAAMLMIFGCGANATVKGSQFEHEDQVWFIQSHPDHNDWVIYCNKNSRPICISVWRGADYNGMPEQH